MIDDELRRLERAWRESDDVDDLDRYLEVALRAVKPEDLIKKHCRLSEDPSPEDRKRAARIFFRCGKAPPPHFFRDGDLIRQHSCTPGYGPWVCVVKGFTLDGLPKAIGTDGHYEYTGCEFDLIELLCPTEYVQ
jgi:hypothetical protein